MIDYYKGIDTQTGQKISYLSELSQMISQQNTAEEIYRTLLEFSEELEARSAYGNETEDSRILAQELPAIKQLFYSQSKKAEYDQCLQEAYTVQKLSSGQVNPRKEEINFEKKIEQVVTDFTTPEIKQPTFLQENRFLVFMSVFVFLLLLLFVIFLKMNFVILVIYALLLLLLYLVFL